MADATIVYRLRSSGPEMLTPEGRLRGKDADALLAEVRQAGAREVPLFGPVALEFSRTMQRRFPDAAPDLSRYRRIEPARTQLAESESLLKRLAPALRPLAEIQYLSPVPTPAWGWGRPWHWPWHWPWSRWFCWLRTTKNYEPWQTYLDPASSGGIGARRAWRKPGGNGQGVRIVDVEEAWHPWHEDLPFVRLCGEPPSGGWAARNWRHGTAVLGMLGARCDCHGMTGIAHGAQLEFASIWQPTWTVANESDAIARAAASLRPGDLILIEEEKEHPTLPRPGGGLARIPVEWWPENYDAILLATLAEVLVVEPAGNSSVDLDCPTLDVPPDTALQTWANPLKRSAGHDCGALIVGAGVAPSQWAGVMQLGTLPLERHPLSNFGSCVDAQGWATDVATCGEDGSLYGPSHDRTYTARFSGTSAASAMVAGVIASAQGIRRAANLPVLLPAEARTHLRNLGTPQVCPQQGPVERVGSLPNAEEWIPPGL